MMEMTIDKIIKDCAEGIKQSELFIKAHQKNMEIGEIKEYQYYIERDKLTIETMRKYQKIEEIYQKWNEVNDFSYNQAMSQIGEILKDGKDNIFLKEMPSVTPQEPKIKVLDRDEAMKKLGTVDVYQARAWITLLKEVDE